MSESLVLEQYTSFPREITIDTDYWKSIIENPPAHNEICGIYKDRTNGDMPT